MNKKTKSKRKTSSTRRKIKQVGCSLKGGDAYNEMPASKIYPQEDYSVDTQRANIDARQQLGGRRKGRSFRKYSRKYYKKSFKGGHPSYLDYGKSADYNTLNKPYNDSNPFYV